MLIILHVEMSSQMVKTFSFLTALRGWMVKQSYSHTMG